MNTSSIATQTEYLSDYPKSTVYDKIENSTRYQLIQMVSFILKLGLHIHPTIPNMNS